MGLWQGHASFAIDPIQRLDRAMHQDRPDAGVEAIEDALGLAEGIGEQDRGPLRRRLPPLQDLAGHRRAALPAVDR